MGDFRHLLTFKWEMWRFDRCRRFMVLCGTSSENLIIFVQFWQYDVSFW